MENNFILPLNLQLFAEEGQKDGFEEVEENSVDELDFEEEGEKETASEVNEDVEDKSSKKKQSRAENAKFAQQRREAKAAKDREEEIRKEAYAKGKKDGKLEASKVNTFTNEPIKDEFDLEVFELQKKIEEEGGDPVSDLPKRWAALRRESVAKAKEEKAKSEESTKKVEEDTKDFIKFIGSNKKASEIFKDKNFQLFINGRLGSKPLKELYQDYQAFKESLGISDKVKESATDKATMPSTIGNTSTKKKIEDMTSEEFEDYWRKKYS